MHSMLGNANTCFGFLNCDMEMMFHKGVISRASVCHFNLPGQLPLCHKTSCDHWNTLFRNMDYKFVAIRKLREALREVQFFRTVILKSQHSFLVISR